VWPLPRVDRRDDAEIRAEFQRFAEWHYPFAFEGGPELGVRYTAPPYFPPERPFQRFAHFMPTLVEASERFRGKRVLDIACNSGFWAIQCALLGACEVVGFDARSELVEHARLVCSIAGIANVSFRELDFWAMKPETLGGQFDVVLSLGILYHLPSPLEALKRMVSMCSGHVLLDTAVEPSTDPIIRLKWEEPDDIRNAARAGIVTHPSPPGVEMMLQHIGCRHYQQIPLRSLDMPRDYLNGRRVSWLIDVSARDRHS
jgi:SAM-dependent methyltransferase